MVTADIYSRSRLAGYDPAVLGEATVVVPGAGALGQNTVMALALSGVGTIIVVDYDDFEEHNITRSPYYPSPEERALHGDGKARIVAHKAARHMTASGGAIYYANAPIQALGDLPFRVADVVCAAVDNPLARAHIAERCKLAGTPFVEAGFHAAELSLAVFSGDQDDPCYRCLNPEKAGAFSCRAYARSSEQAGITPAVQTAAMTLAGLQAEAAIDLLHQRCEIINRRLYFNIRELNARLATLIREPLCPGTHRSLTIGDMPSLPITPSTSVEELLMMANAYVPVRELRFPDAIIVRNTCVKCETLVDVGAPEWRWMMAPWCTSCGGSYAASVARSPCAADSLSAASLPDLAHLTATDVGLAPGASLEVVTTTGETVGFVADGGLEDVAERIEGIVNIVDSETRGGDQG